MIERCFPSTDGSVIWYTDRGGDAADSGGRANAAPTLVFYHGIFESRRAFAKIADAVAARTGWRCVTVDLRGHGRSRADGGTFTPRQYAEDIEALLVHLAGESDSVGQGGYVLSGYSLGSYMVMNYLKEFGFARVRGLVLMDWSPKTLSDADWTLGLMRGAYGRAELRRDLAWIADEATFYKFLANFVYHSVKMPQARGYKARPPLWARVASHFICENTAETRGHLERLWGAFEEADYRALAERIDVPTLLICAVPGSLFVPEAGDYLKERIGETARLVRVGGEGFFGVTHHALPEQRRVLAREIVAFLAAPDVLHSGKSV
ncbi:MAG: alpha/beta hydrolase [Clostridiales Family XIII bacterium]|jgi:pimeloyl-ACP methyl ester carboxylesterase|nr:alpha/beta hydrolase [Clostridiales Family XIII bacterium]